MLRTVGPLVVLLVAAAPLAGQHPAEGPGPGGSAAESAIVATPAATRPGWAVSAGPTLAVRLNDWGDEADRLAPGLDVVAGRRFENGAFMGLRWSGSWFDSPYGMDHRGLASLVLQRPTGLGELESLVGLGAGYAQVVEREFPDPDAPFPGDGAVAVGTLGSWGLSAGVTGAVGLGSRVRLEPAVEFLRVRAGDTTFWTLQSGVRLGVGR